VYLRQKTKCQYSVHYKGALSGLIVNVFCCSADDKPVVNGEHADTSQDVNESQVAADDSQLATANDTSACDVTADTVTVHIT